MIHLNLRKLALVGFAAAALTLAGCSDNDQNTKKADAQASNTPQEVSGTIKIAYVEWASCLAATNVVSSVLENAGYDVQTVSVTAGMLYEGLANGDVDGMVCAWLPTTHKAYYQKTKDRLTNLGPNMKGTKIGLVVPSYVTIDSISDLTKDSVADKFENRIVGIDPGAGIMSKTQQAIKDYNLPEKLVVGSGATMTAALSNAIRQHKPIVVTGWTPHWMWARWDLKYLKDPKVTYGEPENIDTLVRKGLKTDMPVAYGILNNFQWTGNEMGAVMAADREDDTDPKQNAADWVKAHPTLVAKWTQKTASNDATSSEPAQPSKQ